MASPVSTLSLLLITIRVYRIIGTLAVGNLEPRLGSGAEVPTLFNFERYQQLFSKHYGSQLELTTRRVYFMANAFQAYASGVAYKFWKQSYYRALNEFSDWSPLEESKMENWLATGEEVILNNTEARTDAAKPPMKDSNKAAEQLEAEIKASFGEPSLGRLLEAEEPKSVARIKRDALANHGDDSAVLDRAPRPLVIDDLVRSRPEQVAANRHKEAVVPRSNNPNYDALAMEPRTLGLRGQQEQIDRWALTDDGPVEIVRNKASALSRLLNSLKRPRRRFKTGGQELSDQVVVDLRKSGCMFEPRRQGKCGSCYAFAATAIMEYHYCMKTGQLVAFSEQYMIDCGIKHIHRMYGCRGAGGETVPHFVHNFGLELRQRYPYTGEEGVCPYNEGTDLKTTGFIRFELGSMTEIPMSLWEEYLNYGPLYITMAVANDFKHFGGAVYDGRKCPERQSHAMVVVGHGRQDKREYWLLRNSYGQSWGESGYMKLAKDAPARCVFKQAGYTYGTKDGRNFVEPKLINGDPLEEIEGLAGEK